MKDEDRKRIAEIAGSMQCPENFKCAESGLENLCRAKDFGVEEYLDCLEEKPEACSFASSFASGHLCRCSLRVYIAKNLKK